MTGAIAGTIERLREAGVDNPRLDARLLTTEEQIARRVVREPVAYILGHKGFWTLDIAVGPGALVPRPETETLIEQLLKHAPDRTAALDILDLGTGTGCLLLAALSEYPNARGVGVDSSAEALAWARRNVEKQGANARLVECDFTEIDGAYDVILSNPPYIRTGDIAGLAPEVRLYEPVRALDGGADGLDAYRALAPAIRCLLKPGGLVFLEIGAGQGAEVSAILGLEILGIASDLAGVERCVVGRKS
ncbi:MAG: peptide chain release factor N(5)-glutamine methyltransferase [Alphaproteobacteria bacterium]|nr:peptide chain release factor N(5)-glutamine methyltransferase [Alphaproteobacteria bacterium]